ncbi:MAG: hypothetical protein BGO69_13200 [Bacteroidetes bacterium 46-16]|nr:MAG: hypothetical protein BGO69_13200 [Bacteroidetes bacterium 46-16]
MQIPGQLVSFNETTVRYEAFFTFKAYTNTIPFKITAPELQHAEQFVYVFSDLFPGLIDFDNKTIRPLMKNTPELRKTIDDFVDLHKGKLPQLNAVSAFFRTLTEDELFFVFPFEKMPPEFSIMLYNYLAAIVEDKDFNTLQSQMNELFGELLKKYTISAYGETRRIIGERNKTKRICRFCNNTREPLTFGSVAHAISEGLGNKTLILNEECDGCNEYFSQTIEQDIIEYFAFARTMYGIKGKGGNKAFVGKNFKFKNTPSLELQFEDGTDSKEVTSPLKIPLHSSHKITAQNIYRCFCKYFLSVIDADLLPSFSKTIDWINGKFTPEKLPKITQFIFYGRLQSQPTIVAYIRKDDDKRLPFAVCEFHFAFYRYIFIVPFCDKDEADFISDAEYSTFWSTFTHFTKVPGASFHDFSDSKEREMILNIEIELTEKEDSKK